MTEITDNAEGKFELWFFRDMNDAQRLKLFSIFGLPTDEISTLGAQKLVLRRILSALISSPGKDGGQEVEAVELIGIAKEMAEESGFWRSCSGCHNLNEGVPTGPYSNIMKCHLGFGCRECGGVGAIWDNVDYSDFGRHEIDIQPVKPIAWIDPVSLEHLREVNLTTTNIFAHKHSDYVAVYTQPASTALVEAASFLAHRLDDFRQKIDDFDDEREFVGKIVPALDLLRSALSASQPTSREGER